MMRRGGSDRLVLFYGLLWTIYIVTQFRMPWTELLYSEDTPNGGIRQVFFTVGALLALRRLIYTNTLGQLLTMHMGGLLLGALMLVSMLWSSDASLTLKRSLIFVFGYLLLVTLVHAPKWPMRYYMTVIVHGMGWIAWLSIIAYLVFPKTCTTLSIRPGLAGLTVHPNVFGPCLGMAWGLGLGLPAFSKLEIHTKRFLMLGILLALCMTQSMTALLATIAATLLYVVLTIDGYRARCCLLAAFAAICVVPLLGFHHLTALGLELIGRDASMSGRDVLWSRVFDVSLQSPLYGSGYGSFWYEGRGRELVHTWNPRQAHNAYLDVFVDLGALGLLLVLLVIPYRLLVAWQLHASHRGSHQRRAVAAFVSMSAGVLLLGAFGESFLLKLDKFQFFCLFWGILVMENYDHNHLSAEFHALDPRGAHAPQLSPRRGIVTTWLASTPT